MQETIHCPKIAARKKWEWKIYLYVSCTYIYREREREKGGFWDLVTFDSGGVVRERR